MKTTRGTAGFTLIEIMVALAILATGLIILLDSHYGSLRLFSAAQDEMTRQSLLQEAMGLAEVGVLTGQLTGNDDFVRQYEGYTYSYSAELLDPTQGIPLYHVLVTVNGPDNESSTMEMNLYNTRQ